MSTRTRVLLAVLAAVVILALVFFHSATVAYTNYLWFASQSLGGVWGTVVGTELGLTAVFTAVFTALSWVNLAVADRLADRYALQAAGDDVVVHYRGLMARHGTVIRGLVSLAIGLIVGAQAAGQWKHWLLLRHAVSFGVVDPLFHRDVAFYVFTLPFLQFLVGWALAALIVVAVLVALASYLNGGVRPQGHAPRVLPQVKAHLSVLLGLVALVKAVGDALAKFDLLTARDGFAEGAFYVDVHAREPALGLLEIISVVAAVVLLVNIRRQGWALPAIAVGLWAVVAIAVGTIYPSVVEKFVVQPAQSTKELPYIARNIAATRRALGLTHIAVEPFSASQDVTASQLQRHAASLEEVRLWDPAEATETVQKLQDIRAYYTFSRISVNRETINGEQVPVVIGVREINSSQVPSPSWINLHLQYTHGYGAIEALAASSGPSGNPDFLLRDVPLRARAGSFHLATTAIYYGRDLPGYVIVDTRQAELDYQAASGPVESHYRGDGGVPLDSFLRRLAFAVRLSDLNILISNQITPHSRIMFERSILARVEKAAPFLTVGSDPYPVVVNGQLDWVVDAYTTTSRYPYGQAADTSILPPSAPLSGANVNYIRNSVKVVVNAYTGYMRFYVWDPRDPIIRAWEEVFPHMFSPRSAMPAALVAQLRYPKDLFTIQAQMFGLYHLTKPASFYSASDAWSLSADPGSGLPGSPTPTLPNGRPEPMPPQYDEVELPGSHSPQFALIEPYVPISSSTSQQILTGFLVAGSDPGEYGHLTVYVTPRNAQIDGPALVNARINATPAVSSQISLLDQHGSTVEQGSVMVVPVGQSLLYVRPLYVSSQQNPLPEIKDVIVVYGSTVTMAPTLPEALNETFGSHLSTTTGPAASSGNTVSPSVADLISAADSALRQAQSDLKAANLGGYETEVAAAARDLAKAEALEAASAERPTKGSV